MKIEENKSLKEFTTFRIGGNARFFSIIYNEKDLLEALEFIKINKLKYFILGGGSNILVSDNGFDGFVIKMEIKGIDFDIKDNSDIKDNFNIENKEVYIKANSGEIWDDFVNECVKKGLYGLENLSGIPGTVGASPVQNIGAYGCEVKDSICEVRVFDVESNSFLIIKNKDCNFSYRDSLFKRSNRRFIIISVTFRLFKNDNINISYKDLKEYFINKKIDKPDLYQVREAIIFIRKNKLPNINLIGTAGSFFKNPIIDLCKANEIKEKYPNLPIYTTDYKDKVKVSLAWIIDHICEYKGIKKGNVGLYKNQALVIINENNAKSKEIIDFANEIKKIVKDRVNIDIDMEVEYIY